MAITNIDDLDNFAVSTKHSNGMQLLTFHVTTIKTLNPHLVSTTIKNLNEKDFEAIWRVYDSHHIHRNPQKSSK